MKYPVQIPVPSDHAIIVGNGVSEELERRYESCKEKKEKYVEYIEWQH